MATFNSPPSEDFDLSFKVFHELMAKKVTEILLVSSPYRRLYHGRGRTPCRKDHPGIQGLKPLPTSKAYVGIHRPGGFERFIQG